MEENVNPIDKLDLDPNMEFDIFIDDKIVNIPMSGFFIKRLQILGDWLVTSKNPEEVIAAYDKIAEGKELTETFEINLQTFITLMNHIDQCAKEQGATKKMKVSEVRDSLQDATKVVS